MAMTMHLDIVSAETELFSGPAEVVVAPAIMGEVGIHAQVKLRSLSKVVR